MSNVDAIARRIAGVESQGNSSESPPVDEITKLRREILADLTAEATDAVAQRIAGVER